MTIAGNGIALKWKKGERTQRKQWKRAMALP